MWRQRAVVWWAWMLGSGRAAGARGKAPGNGLILSRRLFQMLDYDHFDGCFTLLDLESRFVESLEERGGKEIDMLARTLRRRTAAAAIGPGTLPSASAATFGRRGRNDFPDQLIAALEAGLIDHGAIDMRRDQVRQSGHRHLEE